MRIGILGSGEVARSLGSGFLKLGHEVKISSRHGNSDKTAAWVEANGAAPASAGTFAEAARFGELIALATLGVANESALYAAGLANLNGKILIDATNPLDFSHGFPPRLATVDGGSGGEQAQRLAPGAFVVKAFNTVGHAHMFRPSFPGGPPDMFIAGNDAPAKQQVGDLLHAFGWGVVDVGGIECARYLEAMCLVWVLHGAAVNSWNHAFKFLRK